MISVTLDNSCFDKTSFPLIKELIKLKRNNLIGLWIEGLTRLELERWKGFEDLGVKDLLDIDINLKYEAFHMPLEVAEDPIKLIQYSEQQAGYKLKDLNEIHISIDRIIHSEGFGGKKDINKYVDGKILAKHIIRNRTFFVTKDKSAFINNGKREKLEEKFPGLKIRFLNEEFIDELKQSAV